ncbi:MAG: type II toxin-antitoxin system VapC family toxin [Chloroflexi bacterium]|nr:type II toxin-antitoxin system VapC family toxin [Chloroflexota bacterium]
MNHAIVVDASVVIKLYLDEEYSDMAAALITASVLSGQTIFAPFHLPSEVCNALYNQQRRRSINAQEADEALERFLQLPVTLVSSQELYRRAIRYARENSLPTIYDSLYLVLAQEVNAEFWTADQRLLNSIRPHPPWIRWIGDFTNPSSDDKP